MNAATFLPSLSNPSKLLLSFYKVLPFGIVLVNHQGRILLTNQWVLDRTEKQNQDWVGLELKDVLEPQSREIVLSRLDETLQIGTTQTISFRFHPRVFKLYDHRGELLPQSVMLFPAYSTDQIYGAFVLIQDATERLLSENDLKRQIQKLKTLNEIELALRTLDYQACLSSIVQHVKKHFNASLVALYLVNGDELSLVATDGWEMSNTKPSLRIGEETIGWVAKQAQPAFVNEVAQDDRTIAVFPTNRSKLAVPLMMANQCLGVLDLEREKSNAFTREDLELLELIASSAAVAVHNTRIHQEVERWQTYYRSVMDQTGDVIFTLDRQLRLVNANAAWDEFALSNGGEEWLSGKIEGRSFLEAISGEEQKKWQQICENLIDGRLLSYREEIPCHSPWQERWYELRANPLKDSQQRIIGIIFSLHNITDYKRVNQRLKNTNQRLETLVEFTALLNQDLNLHSMLDQASRRLAEIYVADLVRVITKLPGEEAYHSIVYSSTTDFLNEVRVSSETIRQFIQENEPTGIFYELQNLNSSLSQIIIASQNLKGMLYTVLQYKGKILGLIQVYTQDEQRKFQEEEKTLLETLGIHLSMALANALAYQEQQILAMTDSLTGLYNRRKFLETATSEIERSRRFNRPMSLLMMDLDHFKDFNDTYGHQRGDELLSDLARTLRKALRQFDTLARYGGDEFMLLLPEVDAEDAQKVAKRLVSSVQKMKVLIKKDQSPTYLTMSVGVASFPRHAEDLETLFKAADHALYQAKQAGRNRYMIYNN
ncbi:MAG: hypothetical protein DDG59_02755 [Anaerolineae bacterium]|nr:MAG: hypothetical protein DDG59_02755 [Anaerolineae bacterium]